MVTSRRKITMKYLKTFFIIDVVALLPFDAMLTEGDEAKVGVHQHAQQSVQVVPTVYSSCGVVGVALFCFCWYSA